MFIGFSMTGTVSFLLSYLKRMYMKKHTLLKVNQKGVNFDLAPKKRSSRIPRLISPQPTIEV